MHLQSTRKLMLFACCVSFFHINAINGVVAVVVIVIAAVDITIRFICTHHICISLYDLLHAAWLFKQSHIKCKHSVLVQTIVYRIVFLYSCFEHNRYVCAFSLPFYCLKGQICKWNKKKQQKMVELTFYGIVQFSRTKYFFF